MESIVAALIAKNSLTASPPASDDEIRAFEAELETPLPNGLRMFYSCTNGLQSEDGSLTFAALGSLRSDEFSGWPLLEDLVPLIFGDANDSNPLCVLTRGPLAGMVAHIFHDGETCLRFLDVADMLTNFADAPTLAFAYRSESCRSIAPFAMTHVHEEAFTRLLDEFDPDQEGSSLRLRFAMDLCADTEVHRIAHLLRLGDEFVRDAALRRLNRIDSLDARRVVGNDQREFHAFLRDLEKRGSPEQIQRLNTPMLFAARHRDDFDEWIQRLLD